MNSKFKATYIFYFLIGSTLIFASDTTNSHLYSSTLLDQNDPNYGWESDLNSFNEVPYQEESEIDFPSVHSITRNAGTVYQFTNCGQTGRTGPSQAQANSSYSGGSLSSSVTVSGGIQIWTVPVTGDYKIEAIGAAGGTQLYAGDYPGGMGASMSGEFSLTQGTVLKIIVGQKGENTRASNQDNAAPGGGGGSFVWLSSSNTLLIAGGGGGGGGRNGDGAVNAMTSVNGNAAYGQSNGGSNGNGGRTNYGGSSYWAGGGSGWLTDGTGGNNSSNYNFNSGSQGGQGGRRPLSSGLGGVRWNDGLDEGGDGGFGGGGGGGSDNMGCGGGGGYSGGGGGNYAPSGNSRGGGAGSYNSSSTNISSSVVNTGHGSIAITSLTVPQAFKPQTKEELQTAVDQWTGNNSSALSSYGEINTWDVSLITDMSGLFQQKTSFNDNIANWDVSNVVNMNHMFKDAESFNQNLNSWDVSSVTNMSWMFAHQGAFNNAGSSLNWNTSNVTNMEWMFYASNFNQDISSWDVSSVTRMNQMFYGTTFNQDIGGWNVSNVTDMHRMFIQNNTFNQNISNWNVSHVTNFSGMFAQNQIFNQDISSWDVSGATNMSDMFTVSGPLSEVNKCAIHTAFSGNSNWPYDWSSLCPAAPAVQAQSVTTNEDSPLGITLVGSDINGDALTYAVVSNPSNGSTSINGNVVTYAPNTNFNGTDNFTFTASDGGLTSTPAAVSITIAPVNDAPVIASTPLLNAMDGSAYNYALTVNDVDGDAASVTATTKPDWLTFSSSGSNHTLSGTPSLSNGGLHNIILSASDGNGGVATQNYTLAVSLHSLEISGNSGFRIFSSPISGAVYGDLLDELWTQGAVGSDNPNSNPNIWTFASDWNAITNFTSDAIVPGKGFLMYVYADTDFNGVDDLPKTIRIDGAQSLSGISVGSESSSWNLMGNPYGLSVGIKKMLEANGSFNSTVYTLDPNNPDAPYKFHNGTVGTIENAEIKPFSGFWVKANASGNTFQFPEQSIRKGSLNAPGRTIADGSTGYAEFTFSNGTYNSTTYLSFTEEGEINLDPADADRLVPMSLTDHLTSMIYESNKSLAINNLPFDLTTDLSMDMDVMMLSPTNDNGYATQSEQVDMTWDITNLPEGITLELTDNSTGQSINLTGSLSAVISLPIKGDFSTSGGFMGTYPVVGESQFTLSVFGNVMASIKDDNILLPEVLTLHDAYPNPFNPSTVISFDLKDANMVSLDIYDVSGRLVASLIHDHMIPGNHKVSWNPGDLASGLYLVNLVAGTETFNQKITYIK